MQLDSFIVALNINKKFETYIFYFNLAFFLFYS